MKRIVKSMAAVLLIVSMLLPLSGCVVSVDLEYGKELLKEHMKEAWNEAVPGAEETVREKEEAEGHQPQSIWAGIKRFFGPSSPRECDHRSFVYDPNSHILRCSCGAKQPDREVPSGPEGNPGAGNIDFIAFMAPCIAYRMVYEYGLE